MLMIWRGKKGREETAAVGYQVSVYFIQSLISLKKLNSVLNFYQKWQKEREENQQVPSAHSPCYVFDWGLKTSLFSSRPPVGLANQLMSNHTWLGRARNDLLLTHMLPFLRTKFGTQEYWEYFWIDFTSFWFFHMLFKSIFFFFSYV